MTINDVKNCFRENNINELICRINPPQLMGGTIDLCGEAPDQWIIRRNERGDEGYEKVFDSEDGACRDYLWCVLSEPTYRNGCKPDDLIDYQEKVIPVLRKYGLPPIDYGSAHISRKK